jgi:uncharacterized protein YbjT (DUF2867 family)
VPWPRVPSVGVEASLPDVVSTLQSSHPQRRIFIAGANGATGRTIFGLAQDPQTRALLLPHLRTATAKRLGDNAPAGAVSLDLANTEALHQVLTDSTTVVQLIGTMRKRFSTGDTYETSDVATTHQLVEGCRNTAVDHFILLSSVGADKPRGAYLKAKAKAERIVRDSGIPFTIFRPSAFLGAGHSLPWGVATLMRTFTGPRYHPIPIEDLARTILQTALERSHLEDSLEGTRLWSAVQSSRYEG